MTAKLYPPPLSWWLGRSLYHRVWRVVGAARAWYHAYRLCCLAQSRADFDRAHDLQQQALSELVLAVEDLEVHPPALTDEESCRGK